MDSTDMMQVIMQFTKHLQVPKSRWEKHEEADEPIASVIPEVEPSPKDAKNSNTEKFVVGFNQEPKRPFSMFPPKRWVQKRGTNELKELMEPDFPRNNMIQLEKDTTRIINGKLKGKDVGKPVIPCSFGKYNYRGICDTHCDINMISYEMYNESSTRNRSN